MMRILKLAWRSLDWELKKIIAGIASLLLGAIVATVIVLLLFPDSKPEEHVNKMVAFQEQQSNMRRRQSTATIVTVLVFGAAMAWFRVKWGPKESNAPQGQDVIELGPGSGTDQDGR